MADTKVPVIFLAAERLKQKFIETLITNWSDISCIDQKHKSSPHSVFLSI